MTAKKQPPTPLPPTVTRPHPGANLAPAMLEAARRIADNHLNGLPCIEAIWELAELRARERAQMRLSALHRNRA